MDADSLAGPLVLVAPAQTPTPAELHALAAWVRGGGTLLYAGLPRDAVLDTLGLRLRSLAGDSLSAFSQLRWAGTTALPQPDAWTEGSGPARGFRFAFADSSALLRRSGARPLLRTGDGSVVAVRAPLGAGRVLALSDPAPLTNGALAGSGVAALFARAAADGAGGTGGRVVFDEYHHGYRAGGSALGGTLRFLRGTGVGRALLQLAAVALGLLLLAGRRFGAALPPPPALRRDPLEHVGALGEAYRQAGARRSARALLLAGLQRRLGGRPERGAAGVFEGLRRSVPPSGRPALAALETEWQRGERADLVGLSRGVDQVLTEMRRG